MNRLISPEERAPAIEWDAFVVEDAVVGVLDAHPFASVVIIWRQRRWRAWLRRNRLALIFPNAVLLVEDGDPIASVADVWLHRSRWALDLRLETLGGLALPLANAATPVLAREPGAGGRVERAWWGRGTTDERSPHSRDEASAKNGDGRGSHRDDWLHG